MNKLIISLLLGLAPVLVYADDKAVNTEQHEEANAHKEHHGKEAVVHKEVSEEHKKIADAIMEKRKALPEEIRKELKEFDQAKKLQKEEKHKKYSTLTPEAKKALKEERKMKKHLSKDGKKSVDTLIATQDEMVSASE